MLPRISAVIASVLVDPIREIVNQLDDCGVDEEASHQRAAPCGHEMLNWIFDHLDPVHAHDDAACSARSLSRFGGEGSA